MALATVDMDNCFKKERCLSGPNAGLAYTPGSECQAGYEFNKDICDCEKIETAYAWIERTAYADCLGPANPDGWTEYTSYSVYGPGCYEGISISTSKVQDTCLVSGPTTFENCDTTTYPIIECKNTVWDTTVTITECGQEPYFVTSQTTTVCGSSPTANQGNTAPVTDPDPCGGS